MMTDQFNFPNPLMPGSIWAKDADYDITVVSPVGVGPKGKKGDQGDAFTFDDFTEKEINDIINKLSHVGTESRDSIFVTTEESTSTIPIPWNDFDDFDLMFIDINGLNLVYGIDYTISDGNIVLSTPLSGIGNDVHFRVIEYQVPEGEKNILKYVVASATASVDDNVGTPNVIVTIDEDDNIDFAFSNLKGDWNELTSEIISQIMSDVVTAIETDIVENSFLLDSLYPVGSIYMSANNTDPSTIFGGTWTAWGSGRVPVGVDANDSAFNTVEKTGGEKTHTLTTSEIPSHTHKTSGISKTVVLDLNTHPVSSGSGTGAFYDRELVNLNTLDTGSAGSGYAHNILQPYITCYMWKRTA